MRAAVLALCLLAAGCSRRPPEEWARESAEAGRAHEARWAAYHWYFPEITHTLSARWSTDGHYSGPIIHVTLAMAAKAITEEGAAMVGALNLAGWNREVARLEVVHLDSAGRKVDFPRDPMLRNARLTPAGRVKETELPL